MGHWELKGQDIRLHRLFTERGNKYTFSYFLTLKNLKHRGIMQVFP